MALKITYRISEMIYASLLNCISRPVLIFLAVLLFLVPLSVFLFSCAFGVIAIVALVIFNPESRKEKVWVLSDVGLEIRYSNTQYSLNWEAIEGVTSGSKYTYLVLERGSRLVIPNRVIVEADRETPLQYIQARVGGVT